MRIIDIPYLNVTGPDCEYEVAQCSARVVIRLEMLPRTAATRNNVFRITSQF